MRTAFHLTSQDWEPRLFLRLGSFSLLLDLREGLCEVNGRPLRWFGRTSGELNPLDGLGEGTPIEPPTDTRLSPLMEALTGFIQQTPISPQAVSGKILGWAGGVWFLIATLVSPFGHFGWGWGWGWSFRFWGLAIIGLMGGLAFQAFGTRVRGLSSLVYGGMWWVGLIAEGHPWLGLLAFPILVAAGLSRRLNPWLGVLAVPLFFGAEWRSSLWLLPPWLILAGFLTFQEVRRSHRRLSLPPSPGLKDLARGAEALSNCRLWSQEVEGGALTDAFMLRAEGVTLPGGEPIWFLERGAETLCLLPGALLWIREGIQAELIPWDQVHFQSRPCVWEDPPEVLELAPEQWVLRIQHPGRSPWILMVADAVWGRRCALHWARVLVMDDATGGPLPSPPAPTGEDAGLLQAYRVLGLSPGASPGQVREAYRRLAKTNHPDAHPEASAKMRSEYESRMQAINDAYARLRGEAIA